MIIEDFKKDLKDLLDKFHKESGGIITGLIIEPTISEHVGQEKEVKYEIDLRIK